MATLNSFICLIRAVEAAGTVACVVSLNLITKIMKSTAQHRQSHQNVSLDRLETCRHFFLCMQCQTAGFTGKQFPGCLQKKASIVCCYRGVYIHYELHETHSALASLGLGLVNEGEVTSCIGFWSAN